MEINQRNIKLVLVEPLGEINLGSIARLCKNFGINELRLVSPRCDPLSLPSRKMALKGQPLLEEAKTFSNLLDAVGDCVRVIATCGRKDHGEIPLHSSENSLKWLLTSSPKDAVAIIFGREDYGLTNKELRMAQRVITLPTSKDYQSLNLSHAVAIVLHELVNCSKKETASRKYNEPNPCTPKELNHCLVQAQKLLLEVGFIQEHTSHARMSKIKAMLQRADIRSEEVALIRGILRQTKWFIDN